MKHFAMAMILFTGSTTLAADAVFCKNYVAQTAFIHEQQDLAEKIAVFANKPAVAAPADVMLSKLISAKSPVIVSWFKKRELENKSEEEVAKAWRTYFATNFILTKYPQSDEKINAEIERLVDGALSQYLNQA